MILVSNEGLVLASGPITTDGRYYRYENICYQIDHGYKVYDEELPEGLQPGRTFYVDGVFEDIPIPEKIVSPPSELEEAVSAKLEELKPICEQKIMDGIDYNGLHYSMTITDQLNLETLAIAIMSGSSEVTYHADNEPCRLYSAEEFIKLYKACTAHKIEHTTYFNQLKQHIKSLDTVEEINAVEYGQELTGIGLDS